MHPEAQDEEASFRRGAITEGGHRAVLRAADGVRIEAALEPFRGAGTGRSADGTARPAIVLAHGFTGALDRPAVRRASHSFAQYADVITFSFRGHGRSGGLSTVGDQEVLDLAAAVRWARSPGSGEEDRATRPVATVGFSMGGSVALRHAALYRAGGNGVARSRGAPGGPEGPGEPEADGGPDRPDAPPGDPGREGRTGAHTDAVVAVSAPARWYYRGTAAMRRVHWAIQRPAGRLVSRYGLGTRVHHRDWDPVPLSPVEAAPLIAPTPLLVVHGDRDAYFPLDHPRSLAAAADPSSTELWIEPGFGHAENAAEPDLLERIGEWVTARTTPGTRHHGGGRTDG